MILIVGIRLLYTNCSTHHDAEISIAKSQFARRSYKIGQVVVSDLYLPVFR